MYIEPAFRKPAFTCPNCRITAKFEWAEVFATGSTASGKTPHHVATCDHCHVRTLWAGFAGPPQKRELPDGKTVNIPTTQYALVWPSVLGGPPPSPDLPAQCRADYDEARAVLSLSPRGAAALLRLCTEKLCRHLLGVKEGEGADLNDMVGAMVKNGLPVAIQRSLDTLRVVGNEAVHPGQMDLKDDEATALKLFNAVNIVVHNRITEPQQVEALYGALPASKREGIEQRDKPKK